MISRDECRGCRDDWYNASGHSLNGRCWHAASGTMVTRYRIHRDMLPARHGAFTEVLVPSCRHEDGFYFYEKLPDFVKASDVIRRARSRR